MINGGPPATPINLTFGMPSAAPSPYGGMMGMGGMGNPYMMGGCGGGCGGCGGGCGGCGGMPGYGYMNGFNNPGGPLGQMVGNMLGRKGM